MKLCAWCHLIPLISATTWNQNTYLSVSSGLHLLGFLTLVFQTLTLNLITQQLGELFELFCVCVCVCAMEGYQAWSQDSRASPGQLCHIEMCKYFESRVVVRFKRANACESVAYKDVEVVKHWNFAWLYFIIGSEWSLIRWQRKEV